VIQAITAPSGRQGNVGARSEIEAAIAGKPAPTPVDTPQ